MCVGVCVVLSARKDGSEKEQLIIQPPINMNADARCVCVRLGEYTVTDVILTFANPVRARARKQLVT